MPGLSLEYPADCHHVQQDPEEEQADTVSSSSVLSSIVVLKLFSALGTVTKEASGLKKTGSGLVGDEKRALMSLAATSRWETGSR